MTLLEISSKITDLESKQYKYEGILSEAYAKGIVHYNRADAHLSPKLIKIKKAIENYQKILSAPTKSTNKTDSSNPFNRRLIDSSLGYMGWLRAFYGRNNLSSALKYRASLSLNFHIKQSLNPENAVTPVLLISASNRKNSFFVQNIRNRNVQTLSKAT